MCFDSVAVGAANLALSDFFFDRAYTTSAMNHVSYVVNLVSPYMIKLKDDWIVYSAVNTTVHPLYSFDKLSTPFALGLVKSFSLILVSFFVLLIVLLLVLSVVELTSFGVFDWHQSSKSAFQDSSQNLKSVLFFWYTISFQSFRESLSETSRVIFCFCDFSIALKIFNHLL